MKIGTIALAAAISAAAFSTASADDWPTRPVKAITTTSAGGLSDIFMRALGEELRARWGQPLIIENRPGGSMNLGTRACADSPPDGYTICITNADAMLYNQFLFKKLPFDPETSLQPITNAFHLIHMLVVNAKLGVKTVDELCALSKAKAGTLSYLAPGAPLVLYMETLKKEKGCDWVRVPFRGGGEAVNGMLTGTTPVAFFGIGNFIAHLQAGTIRGIAVDAGKRSPLFPSIPTLKELRPNADLTQADFSLWAPKGTPPALIKKIRDDVAAIGNDPAFTQKNLIQRALDPVFSTPAEFAKYLVDMRVQVDRVAKKANLQPQ